MTRSAMVRLRALGLVAGVLVLAATAIFTDSLDRGATVSHHHTGPVVADQDSPIVVSIAADAKTTSGWTMPLAAFGAALALAIGYFGRRDSSVARASFAVKQRLVRAGRRAPPRVLALQML